MINSLTHRIISSENLERQKMNEAINWANICLKEGIETESISILAILNEENGTLEIRNYLEQSLNQIGLKFLNKKESLSCYIKSYILEILEDKNYELPLRELYQIYMDFEGQKDLRIFYLLYWANESWKHNHENKECYIDDFQPEKLGIILENNANNWLILNNKQYLNIEKIRKTASCDNGHTF
jgi:hypothetical protein